MVRDVDLSVSFSFFWRHWVLCIRILFLPILVYPNINPLPNGLTEWSCYFLQSGVPRIFTDAESAEISDLESQFTQEDDISILDYIRNSRININIRQVFWMICSPEREKDNSMRSLYSFSCTFDLSMESRYACTLFHAWNECMWIVKVTLTLWILLFVAKVEDLSWLHFDFFASCELQI